jgi:excisionase family DNA binding protein
MTGPNTTATNHRRRGAPEAVHALRPTTHDASPNPSREVGSRPSQPASSARAVAEPLLLTVTQAAQRLGISRILLYELLAADEIESITIGRLRRIPVDALTTYINQDRRHT